ncbi:hypothetical protein BH10ACT7_BH10ACT7_05520 [soil metagenome]
MPETWVSPLLTAALVVLTGVYVWQTGRIAKKTAESAGASKLASEAARTAAQAAERSAIIAEASLRHRFKVKPSRHSDGLVWFTVRSRGASVWLHSASLESGHVTRGDDLVQDITPAQLEVPHGETFPRFLRQGPAGVSLQWPVPEYRADDKEISVLVNLQYAFGRDGEKKTERVWAMHPPDQIEKWNKETNYFLDEG